MPNERGTVIGAAIVPTNPLDQYATHDAYWGRGGTRTVADLAERNAIPAQRLEEGMLVYVQADGAIGAMYQLQPGFGVPTVDGDWELFHGGGAGVGVRNEFWVDTAGDDGNDGSQANPFLTWQKAADEATAALPTMGMATIHINNGLYDLATGANFTGNAAGVIKITTDDPSIPAAVLLRGIANNLGYGITVNNPNLVLDIEGFNTQRSAFGLNVLAGNVLIGYVGFNDHAFDVVANGYFSKAKFIQNTNGDAALVGANANGSYGCYAIAGGMIEVDQDISVSLADECFRNEGGRILCRQTRTLTLLPIALPNACAFRTTSGGLSIIRSTISPDGTVAQPLLANANIAFDVDNGTQIMDFSSNYNLDNFTLGIRIINTGKVIDDGNTWLYNNVTQHVLYDQSAQWKSRRHFDTDDIAYQGSNSFQSGIHYEMRNLLRTMR